MLLNALPPTPLPPVAAVVRPARTASRPAPPARLAPAAPAPFAGVALDALAKGGEQRFLGPGGAPRLLPLAPMRPGAPAIVFIHGIGGDPTNQEILIRKAQARGMQVYVMAYDTYGEGGETNARGFADEFRKLSEGGIRDVTVVAHSLGALTFKGALADLTAANGHLEGFDHLRYFALAAPWGGVNVADASLHLLTDAQKLAFARDLAPESAYWRSLVDRTPPPEVDFYNVQGSIDQFRALSWGQARKGDLAAVLAMSKRSITLPGGTHNSAMWDARAADFIFDPAHAPDPATRPGPPLGDALAREAGAIAGQREAFRPRPGEL